VWLLRNKADTHQNITAGGGTLRNERDCLLWHCATSLAVAGIPSQSHTCHQQQAQRGWDCSTPCDQKPFMLARRAWVITTVANLARHAETETVC